MSDQVRFNSRDRIAMVQWSNGTHARMVCRACGSECDMAHVVATPHVLSDRPGMSFNRCSACGTLNCDLSVFTDYDEDNAFTEHAQWMQHYLHSGAGIDFMIRPLQRIGLRPGMSMLDVGCGVGFTVSYWNWAKGDGHGVEPSAYGRLGARHLDPRIIPAYLSDAPTLNGRKFDRVFSSEVIEHVDDTAGFVAELKSVTAQDGILVLTTPNAGFIDPENPWGMIVAALSPGLHRLLFSRQALEDLLRRSGFVHVIVLEVEERLIAYASEVPITLAEDPTAENRSYVQYLLDVSASAANADLRSGLLFRAFKEQVNAGDLDGAFATGRTLRALVQQTYDLDLTDLQQIRERLSNTATFDAFGIAAPYFTPAYLFYAAMLTLQGKAFLPDELQGFETAAELGEHGMAMAPDLFQEAASLYWPAKLHVAIAALRTDQKDKAKRVLLDILNGGTAAIARPDDILRLRATRELGVVYLQSDEPERAMGLFRHVAEQDPDMRADVLALYATARRQAQDQIAPLLNVRRRMIWNKWPNFGLEGSGSVG